MSVKAILTDYVDRHLSELLAMQNADGSFGAYPYSNAQYPFYTMAYALKELPDSRWHGATAIEEALQRALENYCTRVDENGKAEFFGQAGFSWGRNLIGGWPLTCWQETLKLIAADLPPDMLDRQHRKLMTALQIHFQEFEKKRTANPRPFETDTHNLYVWEALMMYRAGVLWQNTDWERLGTDILAQAVQSQKPDGWWSEGGPTVGYNLVTTLALSLYAEWRSNPDALEAMDKAALYHNAFAYPDGSHIETIDGRQRYHAGAGTFLPPSFSRFPAGRAWLARAATALANGPGLTLTGIQGFSWMGFILEHLQDFEPEPPAPAAAHLFPALHSAVVKQSGWCAALCGYETHPGHMGGFRLERQNLLSLWHEKTGLILGGGHSNYQPEFSNFNVIDRRGILHYLHADPEIRLLDNGVQLSMTCGGVPVMLCVRLLDEHRATVQLECPDYSHDIGRNFLVRANLIMVARMGAPIRGAQPAEPLDDRSRFWVEEDFGEGIRHNGWELRIPPRAESAAVRWPVRPYNSYRKDRKTEVRAAAIVVTAQLSPEQPTVEYTIGVP